MLQKDHVSTVKSRKKDLCAVICIDQEPGYGTQSPVNRILSEIQNDLRKEANREGKGSYGSVRLAFVYKNEVSLAVKPFETISQNTPVYFMDNFRRVENNAAHVLFMGLVLLEKARQEEQVSTVKRLYFVTDREFTRLEVNRIIVEDEEGAEISILPRFSDICDETIMYLYKTKQAGDVKLEKLFTDVHIIEGE